MSVIHSICHFYLLAVMEEKVEASVVTQAGIWVTLNTVTLLTLLLYFHLS